MFDSFSSVDDLAKAYWHALSMASALRDFHKETHGLDEHHQQQVINLRSRLMSLYDSHPGFKGPAAEALFKLFLDYQQKEHAFTGNMLGDTSAHLAAATHYGKIAADSIDEAERLNARDAWQLQHDYDQQKRAGSLPTLLDPELSQIYEKYIPTDGCALFSPNSYKYVNQMEDALNTWKNNMTALAQEPPPALPPEPNEPEPFLSPPDSITYASGALSDEQKRLLNLVRAGLGYPTDSPSPADPEVEELLRVGYRDVDTIVAIIKSGHTDLFNGPQIASLMNGLSSKDQLRVVSNVLDYQKAHPDLNKHQIYNYLRFARMKSRTQDLASDIQNSSLTTKYPDATTRLLTRITQYALNSMNTVADPFQVTDDQLKDDGGGWYANVTGVWAEWSRIKVYDASGKLSDFSTPFIIATTPPKAGETDIILKDGTWIEVKNVPNMDYGSSSWKTLKREVTKYMDAGATKIIVELPQGLPAANEKRMIDQLINMGKGRGVTIEVTQPDVPFEPPLGNWGNALP